MMESFVRVVRSGSFTEAARQLGLSPALVSRHVSTLEEQLGVRLLIRSTRTRLLTEEGAYFLEQCEQILARVKESERALRQTKGEPSGTLKVLAPKSFGMVFLADAVVAFSAANADLRVSLVLQDSLHHSFDFAESGADLAVWPREIDASSVITRNIGTYELLVCASPVYLAHHRAPHSPLDLRRHNCLAHLNVDQHDRIWRFEGPDGPETVKIDGTFFSNTALVLRKAALDGLGIALLPRYCVEDDLAAGTLVPLLRSYAIPARPILAVYEKSAWVPRKIDLFVAFLADWIAAGRPAGRLSA